MNQQGPIMTSTSITETTPPTEPPQLAQTSAHAIEQLSSIFSAYNETTNRMRRSYHHLQQEVVRLRQELEQKNEQLQRKNRLAALGEMAAGMAHEIRNPLGAVQLYLSILQRELENQPEQLQWADKISTGVRSLNQIVTDILAFTHDQTCEKAPLRLAELIDEVIDYVRPQLTARAVTIDLNLPDHDLIAHVDVNMMRRALLNLILNAVEASPDQGAITISAAPCPDEPPYTVRIAITDTGPGIKKEVMNKIFNPFFTTKDTGTGLGLAIVHRLIECHSGIITAANHPKTGAVFTIMLT